MGVLDEIVAGVREDLADRRARRSLDELAAVDAWCAALPFDEWTVAKYTLHNKTRNPEALFLAEKHEKS